MTLIEQSWIKFGAFFLVSLPFLLIVNRMQFKMTALRKLQHCSLFTAGICHQKQCVSIIRKSFRRLSREWIAIWMIITKIIFAYKTPLLLSKIWLRIGIDLSFDSWYYYAYIEKNVESFLGAPLCGVLFSLKIENMFTAEQHLRFLSKDADCTLEKHSPL